MKYSSSIHRAGATGVLVIASICRGLAFAATPPMDLAMTTATQWVALAAPDSADRMWSSSSPYMQKSVPKLEWEQYLSKLHAAMGNITDREWNQVVRVDNPPNLPAGEYLNVVYITRFERGLAIEKVSLSPSAEGWVPVGYVVNVVQQASKPASGAVTRAK
jgi:hypothetical protein